MRSAECGIDARPSIPHSAFHIPHSTFRILMYRTSDFEYDLPAELIAQEPLPDRTASRLLVLDRAGSGVRHARFPDFVDLVAPEDVLVLNVSRVIPARLHGKREMGKIAELLLVRELPDGSWIAMGHPGGKLKPGRRVTFGDDSAAEIVDRMSPPPMRSTISAALSSPQVTRRPGSSLPPGWPIATQPPSGSSRTSNRPSPCPTSRL